MLVVYPPKILIVQNIEQLFLEYANGRAYLTPQEIGLYKKDIDLSKLNLHLQMLPDAIISTPLNGFHIKEVTKISTMCEVFNEEPSMKKLLSEVHKLSKIYLTIPVTTSTAERCCSALKRIDTYLSMI